MADEEGAMDMQVARRGLASDNQSGAHPDVLAALAAANEGHVPAYGDDPLTADAVEVLRRHLGPHADVHFAFNGTGANVVCIATLARPFEAVVCPATAHINSDECGAPERMSGSKLLPVATPDGKLTPELLEPMLTGFGVEHHVQPKVVSLTQVTELGTVYTPDEVRAIAELAHSHGMFVHMDGARISNAAAALGVPMRAFVTDAGVDALSFGGTKNGMLFGEAVVLLDPGLAADIRYVRKGLGQLSSKTRFIAAQFIALFGGDLWLRCASNANEMAARLARGLRALPGVTVTQLPQANEVFAILPAKHVVALQSVAPFYVWDDCTSEARFVASWDTTVDDIDGFLSRAADILAVG